MSRITDNTPWPWHQLADGSWQSPCGRYRAIPASEDRCDWRLIVWVEVDAPTGRYGRRVVSMEVTQRLNRMEAARRLARVMEGERVAPAAPAG